MIAAIGWLVMGILLLDAAVWLLILLVVALVSTKRGEFRLGPDDAAFEGDARVDVLIPARDEAHNIERAVRSVLAQSHPDLRCIVLDDGSTDGTADLVAAIDDPRVELVDGGGGPLPEGWMGKPWACQRLGERSDAPWLLFIDADVELMPQAVSRALQYCTEHELDALSGFGDLEMSSLAERVIQPAVTGLLLAGNPFHDVNNPDKPDKALANGQFMLFRRQGYDAVDGHRAVAGNVLDDVGMALALKGAGVPYHMVFMRRLFTCRMYTGGMDMWRGWRKNLFPGMRWSWLNLSMVLAGHFAFTLLPYLTLMVGIVSGDSAWTLLGGSVVLAIQAVRLRFDLLFKSNLLLGQATHAVAQFLLVALLLDSAVSTSLGTATWKGRVLPTRG